MEVLSPTSIAPPPPFASSPAAPRKAPAPSLLDRRPSAQRLLAPSQPLLAEPSLLVSSVTAAAQPLPFVPLTPIMASPRMTPDLRPPPPRPADAQGDYLTRGAPTPSWTSTPPTPPSAHRALAAPRPRTSGETHPGASGSSHARSGSRTRHARPASVPALPSPPPSAASASAIPHGPTHAESSKRPSTHSRSVSPPRAAGGEARRVKRRRTLPHSLSCLSPPPDCARPTVSPHHDEDDEEQDDDDMLRPSLSRAPREESRARRMFTLGDGDASDGECEAAAGEAGGTPPEPHISPYAADAPVDEGTRAGVKRYHALLELLTTEVGYLLDLRALVSVYLEQLPSVTAPVPSPPRPSPSALSISSLGLSRPFPSSRSVAAQTHAQAAGLGPPAPDGGTPADADREHKPPRRPVFSEAEVEVVRRNAGELLAWHERFVRMLEGAAGAHGYGWVFAPVVARRGRAARQEEGVGRVDAAVEAVLEVFLREMPSFAVYEAFCPGHNEAAGVVRAAQDAHPTEWDAYEARCSLLVAHAFELAPEPSPRPHGPVAASASFDSMKRRRHSMSSLTLPPPPPPRPPSTRHAPTSDPLASASAHAVHQAMRLKCLDYLIKPVQRICKYPMLLEALRPKGAAPALLDRAGAAMRAVVARVDRASERQAHRTRAALIAARLCFNGPVSPSAPDAAPAQLSGEFVGALGACLAAGALDVVYHGARVKYLAAFLYVGGYLILAKVPKGGRVYEAKHWFSLAGFQVFEETEDDGALPYGFHLYSASVHLHFAASCELERRCWVACIAEALAAPPPAWAHEPAPNFPPDARPLLFDETVSERSTPLPTPLPTIQSMSELETPADARDTDAPAPPAPSPRRAPKTAGRAEGGGMAALSRRTSTSSVKAFFAPLTFEGRVSRPSAQIRQQVDAAIQDVVSDALVQARARGRMLLRDEELAARRRPPAHVARSTSGMALAGAFTPRRRHESLVFGSVSRRKGSLDGAVDATSDAENPKGGALALTVRPKSSGGKRRSRQPLSVVPLLPHAAPDVDAPPLVQSPEAESPPDMTQSSSAASSNVNSALPSPLEPPLALPPPVAADTLRYPPKRTRSLVDNVRSFFHSRSTSPSPSAGSSPPAAPAPLDAELEAHGALARWWRRGSLRRRVQSSPEVPLDDSAPPTPAASSEDGAYAELAPAGAGLFRSASRRVAFSSIAPMTRRRSLFVASSRSDSRVAEHTHGPPPVALARSRTLKHILQFSRSNSFAARADLDPS